MSNSRPSFSSAIALAVVAVGVILFASDVAAEDIPRSFSTSVKRMIEDIHTSPLDTTVYCGCRFTSDKQVDYNHCDYQPENPSSVRANRIEADHVVPASVLGGALACWGDERKEIEQCYTSSGNLISGRSCCERVNPLYEEAQNNLINLMPAIGELNNTRSDRMFDNIIGEERQYGACNVEVSDDDFEVRDVMRGDVARIWLYMLDRYGSSLNIHIDKQDLTILYYWDLKDPISDEERLRNKRICAKQGTGNHYVAMCE